MSEQEPKLAKAEDVIEASRRRYGVPRAQVEAMIARQMGWPTPDEQRAKANERLLGQLTELGVTERHAKYLLGAYPPERIERQIAWLPFRHPHTPSALVISAIRHDYDPPDGLYVGGADKRERTPASDNPPSPTHEPNPEQKPNTQ